MGECTLKEKYYDNMDRFSNKNSEGQSGIIFLKW